VASTATACLAAAGIAGIVSLPGASATSQQGPSDTGTEVGIAQIAPGSATLFFDWGCDGSYSSVTITFNANGTFTTSSGNNGKWVRIGGTAAGNVAGMLTFQYSGGLSTTYSSVTTSRSASGIQSTFTGTNGCHYIVGTGQMTAEHADTHDDAGTPITR
jgi:hypothetical protein